VHDLKLVAAFAFHTLLAVALFTLIGGAAALLDYYTKILAGFGMAPIVIDAIKATEYLLFGVDLLCFVVYVTRETWLLLRAMLTGLPAPEHRPPAAVTDLPK
jgi:hypothetical protein